MDLPVKTEAEPGSVVLTRHRIAIVAAVSVDDARPPAETG